MNTDLTPSDEEFLQDQPLLVHQIGTFINASGCGQFDSVWEALDEMFAEDEDGLDEIKWIIASDSFPELIRDDFEGHVHNFTPTERQIYDELSLRDQVLYIAAGAHAKARALTVDPFLIDCRNGRGDAVQHALWNALGKIYLGYDKMEELTTAHEDYSPNPHPYPLEREMDLHNNLVGLTYNTTLYTAESDILLLMLNGMLRKISNLNSSCNVTANSELVPTP